MIELLLPCGFDTLEYSWVKATIDICTLTDYSVAKKRQHYPVPQQPLEKKSLQQVLPWCERPPQQRLPSIPRSPSHYLKTSATKAKTGGDERTRRRPEVHRQTFLSFFKLNQIGCRRFRLTEASVSCNILSMVATYEHVNSASSSTCL
jgi:hypothetical protein